MLASSSGQAWGEYFIKYSNTNMNTFEKYEYEYENEYFFKKYSNTFMNT